MNVKHSIAAMLVALAATWSDAGLAQNTYSEDFTGANTANSWYFFNGACLTAGSSSNTVSPGPIPSCLSIDTSYYGQALVGGVNGVAGTAQTLPDPVGSGALRFTNGSCSPGACGYGENGAIVSSTAFNAGQGVQITFKTVSYRGDSGGTGKDGADGMSFYLMNGAVMPGSATWNGIGSWGGSLGYTCSNSNPPYDGLNGAYLGLGMDEYGNFLNGTALEPGYTGATASGDNTALGYGYVPGRIGLRGAGSVSWAYLSTAYPSDYPTSLTTAQRQSAVQSTCQTGTLWNYSTGTGTNTNTVIADYAPIVGAYSVLPSTTAIANETALARPDGVTVQNVFFYDLEITQNGLLSFSYSINGGAFVPVISSQSITASNGALPPTLRFGFAGSTGGDTNIHEILCFKAAPSTVSASSAAVNEKQTSQVQTSSQAYFSFYDPKDWTGRVTAYALIDTGGVVSIANYANWDSECVLTGVPAGTSCFYTGTTTPTTAEPWGPTGRQIWTWNGLDTAANPGTAGVAFEWANLSAAEQTALGGSATGQTRVNYLRGDRSNEINSAGVGIYRARNGVLADIVDASPTWVGPAASPYLNTWKDRYDTTGDAIVENSGQTYASFLAANQGRLNVIYAGANDGLLHGFRTGSEDTLGRVINNVTTPNDGYEVLAYMPGAVVNTIHNSTVNGLDYSNPQYAHTYYVDATPGTGDLYYNNAWHTWLVGGLGPGGAAIYALDITTPSNFTEAKASTQVLGEWSSTTITCSNASNCGQNLGNTYGTPQIRRLHNGMWGVIFGNGYGSSTGDAGIYIMLIPTGTSAAPISPTFIYLSTGAKTGNGIAYVSPADLDGDHITDYVYAGDLKGNVWRFDLTSTSSSNWVVSTFGSGTSPSPLFKTATGQPITTAVVVASALISGTTPQVMVALGTGQRTQFTTTSATTYVTGTTQSMYGVWDWNLSTWNAKSSADYLSLSAAQASSGYGLSAAQPLGQSKLQQQTLTIQSGTPDTVATSNNTFTWAQCTTTCSSAGKFGWFLNLPYTNGKTTAGAVVEEQVVSPPSVFEDALVVNSTIPANNQPLSCSSPTTDGGVTYALSLTNGGTFGANGTPATPATTTFVSAFVNYRDTPTVGIRTNETGALSVVNTQESTSFLVGQDISVTAGVAPGGTQQVALSDTSVNRLTWVELR